MRGVLEQVVSSVLGLVQLIMDKLQQSFSALRFNGSAALDASSPPDLPDSQVSVSEADSNAQSNTSYGFFGGVLGEAKNLVKLLDLVKNDAPKIPQAFNAVLDAGRSVVSSIWNPISYFFGGPSSD